MVLRLTPGNQVWARVQGFGVRCCCCLQKGVRFHCHKCTVIQTPGQLGTPQVERDHQRRTRTPEGGPRFVDIHCVIPEDSGNNKETGEHQNQRPHRRQARYQRRRTVPTNILSFEAMDGRSVNVRSTAPHLSAFTESNLNVEKHLCTLAVKVQRRIVGTSIVR